MLSYYLNFISSDSTQSVSAPVTCNKIIVIDAGHGSPDGGAVGKSGVEEKDLNLIISGKIGDLLIRSGAKVVYTRNNDKCIVDTNNKKLRQIKIEDLELRKQIINQSNADVFISIHMNKFEDEKYYGAQVFYDGELKENKILAESIQSSLIEFADPSNTRKIKHVNGKMFLLKNNKMPSVLIECGFLSNIREEKLLCDNNYQDKIAYAVFLGIMKFLDK